MFVLRLVAALVLPFFLNSSLFGQFGPRQQAVPFGDRGADPDAGIRTQTRAYDRFVAMNNDRAAAQAAFSIASIYERRQDYVNAETWYRTCYVKGQIQCSKNFIDLIILKQVQVNDTNAIRPFVEARAVCGSHIAREYALAKYHETPAQLPIVQNQSITTCGLAGPNDRQEKNLAAEAMQAQRRQQLAEYYRQHPDQTPEAQAQDAAKGAALVLGALVIMAAAMPASGEGSIACNKFRNGFPGSDASACDPPSRK